MVRLTPKQEKFVQALAAGASQREAYRGAYSCSRWKEGSIDVAASRLFAQPKVSLRYDELITELASRVLWDREKAARELLEVRELALEHIRKTKGDSKNIDDHGKRELADLPKTAVQLVIASTAELNKMFRLYEDTSAGDGRVQVVDDV